ncbi:MAG: thioredoxin family protein [Tetrasphaera sp.]
MSDYQEEQPLREEIDALAGPAVLAFGTNWCGYCRVADRFVEPALADHPEVPLLQVEDGRGRRLGRSFRVKLWPTLIFLRDGTEVARVVRPASRAPLDAALARLLTPSPDDGASAIDVE